MKSELKPCCGNRPYLLRESPFPKAGYYVKCNICCKETHIFRLKSEAIKAWNQRKESKDE